MDLRQMNVIKAVLETGSTSAAAKSLNVSQPAISKTIKLMEDELGMPLFERLGKRLRPTPQALAMMPDVGRMLSSYNALKQRLTKIKLGKRGLIKIAAAARVAPWLLPDAIKRHHDQNPEVDYTIITTTTAEVFRLVADNEVDLGICPNSVKYKAVRSRAIKGSMVVCAMPLGHPLAELAVVTAADLVPYPIISSDFNDPILGARIADSFSAYSLAPRVLIESNLSLTSLALVRSGLGVAITAFTALIEGVTVRPFHPRIELSTHIVLGEERLSSPLISDFCNHIEKCAEQLQDRFPS